MSIAAVSSGYSVNYNYTYFRSYCPIGVALIRRSHPDLPLVQVRWKHTWGISASWGKRLQLLYFYPPKLFSGLTLMCHRPWQWTTRMCRCVFWRACAPEGRKGCEDALKPCAQWSFALSVSMVRSWLLGPQTVWLGWSGFLPRLCWGKPPENSRTKRELVEEAKEEWSRCWSPC